MWLLLARKENRGHDGYAPWPWPASLCFKVALMNDK